MATLNLSYAKSRLAFLQIVLIILIVLDIELCNLFLLHIIKHIYLLGLEYFNRYYMIQVSNRTIDKMHWMCTKVILNTSERRQLKTSVNFEFIQHVKQNFIQLSFVNSNLFNENYRISIIYIRDLKFSK